MTWRQNKGMRVQPSDADHWRLGARLVISSTSPNHRGFNPMRAVVQNRLSRVPGYAGTESECTTADAEADWNASNRRR